MVGMFQEGYTNRQIGDMLGRKPSAIRSRLKNNGFLN